MESKKQRNKRIVGNNMKYFACKKFFHKDYNKDKSIKTFVGNILNYGNKLNYTKGCFGKVKKIVIL